jgi:hypothetical protein
VPKLLLIVPFALQAAVLVVDERLFHRARGLPAWERWGHPLDSLTVLACYVWLVATSPSRGHVLVYTALASFSCLFVTKDEIVHLRLCSPGEQWMHSLLYLLHPVVLIAAGALWWTHRMRGLIVSEVALTGALATYQWVYWRRR